MALFQLVQESLIYTQITHKFIHNRYLYILKKLAPFPPPLDS